MNPSPPSDPLFCGRCGASRADPEDLYCRSCGTKLDGQSATGPGGDALGALARPVVIGASDQALPWRRPIWLVILLTIVTFGLYTIVWFGVSWAEIKRERKDPQMHPFWHSLTLLVPVYSLFRMHAHFRVLNEIGSGRGLRPVFAPSTAVICWAISNGIDAVSFRAGDSLPGLLDLSLGALSTLLSVVVIVGGQRSLNNYWQSYSKGGQIIGIRNVHWGEWIVLAIGSPLLLLYLMTELLA